MILEKRVVGIEVRAGAIAGMRTDDGVLHTAKRYLSNSDPKQTVALTGSEHFPREYLKRLDHDSSCGNYTMNIRLRKLGLFGGALAQSVMPEAFESRGELE